MKEKQLHTITKIYISTIDTKFDKHDNKGTMYEIVREVDKETIIK